MGLMSLYLSLRAENRHEIDALFNKSRQGNTRAMSGNSAVSIMKSEYIGFRLMLKRESKNHR